FALLIAFGKHLKPLYSLLYSYLPYFNKFRVPVMILVLVQLAVAALAALGLEAALSTPEGAPSSSSAAKGSAASRARTKPKSGSDPGALWMRAAILAGAGAIGAVVLLQLLGPSLTATASKAREYMNANLARTALDMATVDALKSGIFLAAGFAVIAFQRRGKLSRTAAVLLVVGITAVDLWLVDRKIIDPMLGSKNQYAENFTETPEITFLKKDSSEFRVLPLRFDDSRLAAYGIASVLGYHPAKPRLYQAFMDTVGIPNFRILKLLNVKYVLTDGYFPDTTTTVILRHDGPVKAYEVKGALPRAFVVHRLHPTLDNSTALAFLRTASFFDPSAEALWTDPPPYPTMSEPATPDSVTRIRYGMNESEYMVSTAAPGLFVQVDQYDPDWTATIDGKPAEIHRVNYLMRGIEIPAGVHRVRLTYRPAALTAGLRLTSASLAATLLLGVAGLWQLWRRRRKASKAAAPGAESA
ncbi:MAG TPA: YfhO family protein, partial [Candidatus Eisenbacteria bacterium]|nr:YfhO family protein [Candidatus Eisenbacteria bacterium]